MKNPFTLLTTLLILSLSLLTSCSPSFKSGGFLIPVLLGLASFWSFSRWKWGLFKPEVKGTYWPAICAILFGIAFVLITILMALEV